MGRRMLEALVATITIVLLPASHVKAAEFLVGGDAGWGFVPTASYYSDWAAQITFVPGDKLNFRYDPTEHNVQQVSLSDYSSCNTLNPMLQYQSGDDLVPLPQPGNYYFICGFSGHCDGGGMLLKVTVVAAAATGSTPPPFPNHPPPPPNHPPVPPPIYNPPPSSPVPQPLPSSPPTLNVSPPPPSPFLFPPSPPSPPPPTPPHDSFNQNQTMSDSPPAPPPSPHDNLNRNQTMSGSPPGPPASPPPPPSNHTSAPTPSDYDPDTARARHIGMDLVFTGLVIAAAVIF